MSAHNHDEEILKRFKPTGRIKPLNGATAKCQELNEMDSKSMEAAMQISFMNSMVLTLDEAFLDDAANQMDIQASHYEATAVLNRSWTREGADLLREQAKCMRLLLDYIKSNKQISELRNKLDRVNGLKKQFSEQFGI